MVKSKAAASEGQLKVGSVRPGNFSAQKKNRGQRKGTDPGSTMVDYRMPESVPPAPTGPRWNRDPTNRCNQKVY